MAALERKDEYLQSLSRRVCAPRSEEACRSLRAPSDPKRKRKKPRRARRAQGAPHRPPWAGPGPQRTVSALGSFSTVDLLRKRLHEKIEERRGQVSNKSLSTEEVEKRRQRRRQERERRKRKKKELKMKATLEPLEAEAPSGERSTEEQSTEEQRNDVAPLVFNKVEVHDEPLNKVMKKQKKKESVKGNITPMTGKNYKQLLSRLEGRKSKLEELRAKDQEKAKQFEKKIKWTNVLYKAEGLKIKDDEGMLKSALKRKERQKEQRKRRWDKRVQTTAEKMQHRQDKRSRNIKKKKLAKLEKKKNRARKRGRIMPEDLAKAGVK